MLTGLASTFYKFQGVLLVGTRTRFGATNTQAAFAQPRRRLARKRPQEETVKRPPLSWLENLSLERIAQASRAEVRLWLREYSRHSKQIRDRFVADSLVQAIAQKGRDMGIPFPVHIPIVEPSL